MAWYTIIKPTDKNPKVNTTVFKSSSEIIVTGSSIDIGSDHGVQEPWSN